MVCILHSADLRAAHNGLFCALRPVITKGSSVASIGGSRASREPEGDHEA
jgi:hypothetical protein